MLSDTTATRVQSVASRIEGLLPSWSLDCAFAFGSTARDESLPGSDIDLWFLGHSPDRIYLDKVWRTGRFAESLDSFLGEYLGCQVVDIDSWGDIYRSVGMSPPLAFGSPIADTRWLLWQLAGEDEWQSFLYVATGQCLLDPHGFYSGLRELLWSELPFHIHQDHGIIRRLKLLCEAEKSQLLADLASLSGREVDGCTTDHTIWLWPAIECIRDTVVLLSLVIHGRPVYRREDVLGFIEERFPQHLETARELYRYKANLEGRQSLGAILGASASTRSQTLLPITEAVLSFWHAAMAQVDRCILLDQSKIGFGTPQWRESNHATYREFYRCHTGP